MYIPHHFKNENLDQVRDFIRANSFGIMLTAHQKRMWGSHIPLELEQDLSGQEVIYGHISKANHQLQDFNHQEDEVLIIFNGPHTYVSSTWYDHENVPTWNYVAVHIYGRLEIIGDQELTYSLEKLMDKYEVQMEEPLKMKDLSAQTMKQIKGIIGFKIHITEIQAAYKLSQNRNKGDHGRIVEELGKSDSEGAKGVASLMKSQRG